MADMPHVAIYKGAEIHDFQDEARIHDVVIPELDAVFAAAESTDALLSVLADPYKSPEARLLAFRLLAEPAEQLEAGRRRAPIDLTRARAFRAGLGSLKHASHDFYGTWLQHQVRPGDPPFPPRPPEHAEALREAQRKARAA